MTEQHFLHSASAIRRQHSHLQTTNRRIHMQMNNQIQFLSTLRMTRGHYEKQNATWPFELYGQLVSIPELHTILTNGSSVMLLEYLLFSSQSSFSAFPLFGLNQMFLMQELISCKHSDISAAINQLKIYLAEGHQHALFPGYWKGEKVNLCGIL